MACLFVCVTVPLILIKDISADLAGPHPCSAVYTADSYMLRAVKPIALQ